ncbi:MAG: glycosyltransferase, partial [Candidatus Dormibacteraeota bacterium]|nr:glycosyltransferase [Candidatus Dormibacteraeota bacterium]
MTVLVPSRNEAGNVTTMAQRLDAALRPLRMSWELLFVDDSDDETPAVIESLHAHERRIRLLHRPRRRRRGGLSGAVVAGARVARGRSVVVLDGDLQHPPELVPELATLVGTGYCDIAVASRYVPGAAATGLSSRRRRLASAACTGFAHLLVRGTRGVHDPMSGFFATRRDSIVDKRLHPRGFKILMELLGRNPAAQVAELPFAMAERESGRSKAGPIEGMRFLWHVSRLARPTFRTMGAAIVRCAALAPLLAILAVQGWLSYRLVHANTAFVDEATYLSAGHYILQMGPRSGGMHFATYFSGAPAIYPVLAAFVDSFAGLDGARYMSLAFMLIATVLCYATASRLWGRPAGWFAAGIFVTTQGTQFLG